MASESETPAAGSGALRRVSAAEIARDWGTSRAYVSNCINKKGCPADSLEAARKWRSENARYGIGYRSKGAPATSERKAAAIESETPVLVKATPAGPVARDDLTSLESSLGAAITVEEEALRLVREAQLGTEKASVLESRLRAYNVACKNRSERESAVREEMERRKILVRMDEAKELCGRGMRVIIPKLRGLGSRIGVRCNQADPVLAADAIDSEVASILAEADQTYAA